MYQALRKNADRYQRGTITIEAWEREVWRILAARYGDGLLDQAERTRRYLDRSRASRTNTLPGKPLPAVSHSRVWATAHGSV